MNKEDERREFVDQPMSQDPHDQLLLQIRGAVAEDERSLIAERMRRGRRQKYQAGCLLPWTRPPTAIALIQHDHERWQACGSTQQKPRW